MSTADAWNVGPDRTALIFLCFDAMKRAESARDFDALSLARLVSNGYSGRVLDDACERFRESQRRLQVQLDFLAFLTALPK